jgi:predicted transport protein
MSDYLTIKTGTIPNIKNVYETFKIYFSKKGEIENVDNIIADVNKYSKYFVRMALEKEENIKLREAFSDLNDLKVDVAYPFLLNIYSDFEEGTINQETFLDILSFIQSYVFRRFVCGIPTNSLNKTFATLYKSIDKENYLDSLKAAFVFMSNYRRFPSDIEFVKELKEKDLYNTKNRNFWLRRFENYNRKERVKVEEYTIEHIMPQNTNLSNEWKEMLGENWKYIHENYLHTIGNLTLTGYNSELSDKPFSQKKSMEGGFDDSPLRLNRSLQQVSAWNETTIKERAEALAKTMIEIWSYPTVSEEILEKYKPEAEKEEGKVYTIEDHLFLTEGPMKELFEIVRKRILNIDASVKEEFLKFYVAYKAATNFVDIVPQKSKLRFFLNIDYEEIYDPKNLCTDVTNKGHWGNGNTEVNLSSSEQLEDVLDLIKQAFEKNSES